MLRGMSAARWMGRPRAGVLLVGVLVLGAWGSGCTQHASETGPPAASAPPTTADARIPTPTAASGPPAAEVPTDGDLGAALPGPAQVGGVGGYTSCVSEQQVCYLELDREADPTLSWVRAADRAGAFVPGGRWAWLEVRRPPEDWMVPAALSDARALCQVGEWSDPGDPRGFLPRPPMEGAGKRFSVSRAGFEGHRCAAEIGPQGAERHQSHRITAVRDDVVVSVEASSRSLVLRLFEEYVDRLGWPTSSS